MTETDPKRSPWPRAGRLSRIRPFLVMALLARTRALEAAGRSIVHMEIGEPDFTTPEPIIAAGRRALAEGRTHYTPAAGLPRLREAIAAHYHARYGLALDPARILVTPGGSGALLLVMAALVEPGREVLLADPGYPCNRNFVELFGGRARGVPVGPEDRFQLRAERLEAVLAAETAAVMVATPSNPTGTLLSGAELAALHARCVAARTALVVDEIYHGLSYLDRPLPTAAALDPAPFVVNSFSKYYGMTGWRLGWLVAPPDYVEALDNLAQNLFLAAPTPAQWAALAAFAPETQAELERRRARFRRRRDFLVPALRELGFGIPCEPEGAFYVYADCSGLADDSLTLAHELLERAGVAVTPGLDFGRHAPERYLRFAYTTSLAQLEAGVERMRRFLS